MQGKYKVLLVDDDASVCKAYTMLLKSDGHEVQTVDNGGAALAMLKAGKFDLIITDYLMPGMQGDELARLIKQNWPNYPIIMATASVEKLNDAGKGKAAVDYVLEKPFTLAELREAMIWVISLWPETGVF